MKYLLACVWLLLFASSAYPQKVTVDWDRTTNFSNYKTYAWGEGTPLQNPLMAQRVSNGIDEHLAAKGFQKVEIGANPDLVVLYHAAVGAETQLNMSNTSGFDWGAMWGTGMSATSTEKIPVGELVIDIGDAKTKKLLWMSKASDTLSDKPEKNEKKIDSALNKMFQKFPPSAN
jgi:hypothetical protein